MSSNTDAVQAAEQELSNQRETLDKLRADRVELSRQQDEALADSAGLPARLAAGEKGVTAQQVANARALAGGYAEGLAVLDAEISAHAERVRLAKSALLGARINSDTGGLLSTEQIEAKVAQACEQVDAVLFALADDLQAHNELLESLYAVVKEATDPANGGGTVPGVSVPSSDPFNHSIRSDRGTYSRIAVSSRMNDAAGGSYHRWQADRNAGAIAAQQAEEQRAQAERERRYAEVQEARLAEERRAKNGQQPDSDKPLRLNGTAARRAARVHPLEDETGSILGQ